MQLSDPLSPELEVLPAVVTRPPKGLWRETLERLVRKPSAVLGLVILGTLILIAIFAPIIATHDPLDVLLDVPQEGVVKRMDPCIHLLGCPSAGDHLMNMTADQPLTAVMLSGTNALIVGASGNAITVWSAETGNQMMTFQHDQPVTALSVSPNDQKILSASGNELYIWDVNQRQLGRTLEHEGGATLVEWNADGTRFLSADAHHVRLWDATLWNQVGVIELETPLVAAAWNANGTLMMTASGNSIQLWNAFVASEVAKMEHEAPVTSAAFNSNNSRILTTSGSTLHIWDAATYTEKLVIEYDSELTHGAWGENLSRGIRYVMASSGETGVVWNADNGELRLELPHGAPITAISSSPLATRIFTRSEQAIHVWEASDGSSVLTIDLEQPIVNAMWQSTGGAIMVAEGQNLDIVKTSDYQYVMGTDGNVRDQFSRVIYGTRFSLLVGITTVTLAVLIGVIAGSVAGYVGGWVDNMIMRIMDVLLAFPPLILAIAVVTVLGPGLINALLAISVTFIPAYARVARSGVLSVKEEDYVTADRVLGVRPIRILFRRILPNAMAPLIVQATLGIGTAILDAAALSFLGLGAQPPTPEWGAMLGAERNQVFTAPHLVFYPGIAIMITVLAFNLLGDGLRDALDPRLDR